MRLLTCGACVGGGYAAAGVAEDDADAAPRPALSRRVDGRRAVLRPSAVRKDVYTAKFDYRLRRPCRTENREHRRDGYGFARAFGHPLTPRPELTRGGVRRGVSRGAEGRRARGRVQLLGTVRRKNIAEEREKPSFQEPESRDLQSLISPFYGRLLPPAKKKAKRKAKLSGRAGENS